MSESERREQALQEYRKKLLQQKEIEAKVKTLREQVKQAKKEYEKTEEDLKALQSVGQIIAEVLRQLDEERCKCSHSEKILHLGTCRLSAFSNDMLARITQSSSILQCDSHCQGKQRAAVCRGMPQQSGEGKAESWN